MTIDEENDLLELFDKPTRSRKPRTNPELANLDARTYIDAAIQFINSGKKIIELNNDNNENPANPANPFAGRSVNSIAAGIRSILRKAGYTNSQLRVMTYTNAAGRPTIYLINVIAARRQPLTTPVIPVTPK